MLAKSRQKLIAIVGTTGVGKTKLGVELAKRLNAEVVSADSMQVYKYLDIGSAKVTEEEADGVPHHLISTTEPTDNYFVRKFVRDARAAITDVTSRSQLPIVVGGTFYYTEALLWRTFLSETASDKFLEEMGDDEIKAESKTPQTQKEDSDNEDAKSDEDQTDVSELYERLKEVDPLAATRLHPNDYRKIRRSLEVYDRTGQKHSDIILKTGESRGVTGECNYDCILLWLDCQAETLDDRLNSRVDQMMRDGLVGEIVNLRRILKEDMEGAASSDSEEKEKKFEDYNIFQGIGFKEFQPYFDVLTAEERSQTSNADISSSASRPSGAFSQAVSRALSADTLRSVSSSRSRSGGNGLPLYRLPSNRTLATHRENPEANEVLAQCVASIKQRTRRFSRKQRTWIRNRLTSIPNVYCYRFDTSDASEWNDVVLSPALQICQAFLDNKPVAPSEFAHLSRNLPAVTQVARHSLKTWRKFDCDTCDRTFNGQYEWNKHVSGRRHRKKLRGTSRREELEAKGDAVRAERKRKRAEIDEAIASARANNVNISTSMFTK